MTTISISQVERAEYIHRHVSDFGAILRTGDLRSPQFVVIDGYVWLGPNDERGLGAYLHAATGGNIPVIGVAKNRFRETAHAVELYRGRSSRPLFVTAIGMSRGDASKQIEPMHGNHRAPTILQLVDGLSRDSEC